MKGTATVLLVAAVALAAAGRDEDERPRTAVVRPAPVPAIPLEGGTAPIPVGLRLADASDEVRDAFRRPPRAGVLFDVGTGEVLWRRRPTRRLPIASLTKMMTAIVVAEATRPRERAFVSRRALTYGGSGVGLLPRGRRVRVDVLLHGLLLPSGNDAARVLAEHVGGSLRGFVAMMNERASAMGLACTRFSAPDGLRDAGNRSCAADLASMARALLRKPLLARIVGRRSAILPLPQIEGRRLYLYNHNPLLRTDYRGTTGVKTGYTTAAGRCFVATARRGGVHLGVVVLDSPDPGRQARHLLDRGFAHALGRP